MTNTNENKTRERSPRENNNCGCGPIVVGTMIGICGYLGFISPAMHNQKPAVEPEPTIEYRRVITEKDKIVTYKDGHKEFYVAQPDGSYITFQQYEANQRAQLESNLKNLETKITGGKIK